MKRLLSGLLAVLAVIPSLAQEPATEDKVRVPAGTIARLTLQTPISSKLAEVGDRIKATLTEDLLDKDERVLLREGTEFIGRITHVKAARMMHQQASMTLVFESIKTETGLQKISADLTDIIDYGNEQRLRSNKGTGKVKGGASGTRLGQNTIRGGMVGTGIGLTGVIFGGGLTTFRIGLGIGLGAGMILTKGNEIRLNTETILRIRFKE